MTIENVQVSHLRKHPDYIRGQHSLKYVEELATVLMDAKGEWPFTGQPVLLQPIPADHKDFEDGGRYWIIDGTHRHAAAVAVERKTIPAKILSGLTPVDAISMQIKTNNSHGLRLSPAAQTKAILKLHELKVQGKDIAEKCGLHPSSVSRIIKGKQRPDDPEKTHGGDRTGKKKPVKFDSENWMKGLNRILKGWEKHGTKIRKAGFPEKYSRAMDTLVSILYADDGGKE